MFNNGFPKEWSTLRKLAWLYRTVINAVSAVLKTVTGDPIHILDALAKPAQALSVKLEPVQDLHGYDNPWPAGGGVNKASFAELQSITSNGITVTNNGDGSITVNGTATASVNIVLMSQVSIENGAWTISGVPSNAAGSSFSIWARNAPSKSEYARTYNGVSGTVNITTGTIYIYMTVSKGTTVGNVKCFIQLESGSTATAWSPFENLCPISGRTSATVTRTGVNFDPYGDLNSTARLWGSNNAYQKLAFQSLPVGQYTMSCKFKLLTNPASEANVQYGVLVRYSDGNGGYKVIIPYQLTTEAAVVGGVYEWSKTFTISESLANEDTLSVYFYCADGGTSQTTANAYDIQIEYGSTATAYEPYAGNTYTIQLGDTVYGGTLDVTTGKLTVDMAMVDMGTLNWMYYSAQRRIVAQVNSGKPAGTNVGLDGACSVYKVVNTAYRQAPDKSIVIGNNFISNSYAAMVVYDSDYTDAETFKTAVSGQTLVFPLKNPVTYQLTPTEVTTLPGTNNIWADAGDVTVTYLADGNASDEEALNILLGGRYVNNHSEDEPTDREALNIVLGGNER